MSSNSETNLRFEKKILLFTDLVKSTQLSRKLGVHRYSEIKDQEEQKARDAMGRCRGYEVDQTDGFFILFDTLADAVSFAFHYQYDLRQISVPEDFQLEARIGIHFDKVALKENEPEYVDRGAKRLAVRGPAVALTQRVMDLGGAGRILLTAEAYQFKDQITIDQNWDWHSHGLYPLKGAGEVKIFEVTRQGETFPPPGQKQEVSEPTPRAPQRLNLHTRAKDSFLSRKDQLTTLLEILHPDSEPGTICLIRGSGGVGKTYFLHHYLHHHHSDWPGGCFRVELDEASTAEEILVELTAQLDLDDPAKLPDRLRGPRSLVCIENIDSKDRLSAFLQVAKQLGPVYLLGTARYRAPTFLNTHLIDLSPFSLDESLRFLEFKIGQKIHDEQRSRYSNLVESLGGLPRALNNIGPRLRSLRSPELLLESLRKKKFRLGPAEMGAPKEKEDRHLLGPSFLLSMEAFQEDVRSFQEEGLVETDVSFDQALRILAYAPPADWGISLGNAWTGLGEIEFLEFQQLAEDNSILEPRRADDGTQRWVLPPLFAEFLRSQEENDTLKNTFQRRTDEFFIKALKDQENWAELEDERIQLTSWLDRLPDREEIRVFEAAGKYAVQNGPLRIWFEFMQRVVRREDFLPSKLSHAYETLCALSSAIGEHETTLLYAQEKYEHDRTEGDSRGCAIALGWTAKAHSALSDYEEAEKALSKRSTYLSPEDEDLLAKQYEELAKLEKIRHRYDLALDYRRQELELYEKFADRHPPRRADITRRKIANLRVRRAESLKKSAIQEIEDAIRSLDRVIESHEERRERRLMAIAIGKKANALIALGKKEGRLEERLEEALHLRFKEEIPIYDETGDTFSRAIAQGRVAEIYEMRGEWDRAILIRMEEELPVYERRMMRREEMKCRHALGHSFLKRGKAEDHGLAEIQLKRALGTARILNAVKRQEEILELIREHQIEDEIDLSVLRS